MKDRTNKQTKEERIKLIKRLAEMEEFWKSLAKIKLEEMAKEK